MDDKVKIKEFEKKFRDFYPEKSYILLKILKKITGPENYLKLKKICSKAKLNYKNYFLLGRSEKYFLDDMKKIEDLLDECVNREIERRTSSRALQYLQDRFEKELNKRFKIRSKDVPTFTSQEFIHLILHNKEEQKLKKIKEEEYHKSKKKKKRNIKRSQCSQNQGLFKKEKTQNEFVLNLRKKKKNKLMNVKNTQELRKIRLGGRRKGKKIVSSQESSQNQQRRKKNNSQSRSQLKKKKLNGKFRLFSDRKKLTKDNDFKFKIHRHVDLKVDELNPISEFSDDISDDIESADASKRLFEFNLKMKQREKIHLEFLHRIKNINVFLDRTVQSLEKMSLVEAKKRRSSSVLRFQIKNFFVKKNIFSGKFYHIEMDFLDLDGEDNLPQGYNDCIFIGRLNFCCHFTSKKDDVFLLYDPSLEFLKEQQTILVYFRLFEKEKT